MYPIDILLEEHKLVERVIGLTEKIQSKLSDEKRIPATVFWKLVDFLQGYADVIHHSKEEDVLFVQMKEHEEELPSAVWDKIGVLIEEHIEALDLANEMHKAIREYRQGKPKARKTILKAISRYIEMMRPHFQAEENDVFPAMVSVLSDKEKARTKADFERFDSLVGGAEAHKRYQKIVAELEKDIA
ncbi:MAG: hemerythrin domain-containing protein [Promethearchaeota archaeon]